MLQFLEFLSDISGGEAAFQMWLALALVVLSIAVFTAKSPFVKFLSAVFTVVTIAIYVADKNRHWFL
jgi:hypothetical protein